MFGTGYEELVDQNVCPRAHLNSYNSLPVALSTLVVPVKYDEDESIGQDEAYTAMETSNAAKNNPIRETFIKPPSMGAQGRAAGLSLFFSTPQ